MASILKVFLILAGILLLALINRVCILVISKQKYGLKIKISSFIVLITINIMLLYIMNGVLGKLMFLIPLVLFGPSYTLFSNRKRKKD